MRLESTLRLVGVSAQRIDGVEMFFDDAIHGDAVQKNANERHPGFSNCRKEGAERSTESAHIAAFARHG